MTTLENTENMVETSNGMGALGTTLNECVNLFFQIGAMRGKSKKALLHLFSKAYNENPLVATKVLFWVRDVRGGAGERQIFHGISPSSNCSTGSWKARPVASISSNTKSR